MDTVWDHLSADLNCRTLITSAVDLCTFSGKMSGRQPLSSDLHPSDSFNPAGANTQLPFGDDPATLVYSLLSDTTRFSVSPRQCLSQVGGWGGSSVRVSVRNNTYNRLFNCIQNALWHDYCFEQYTVLPTNYLSIFLYLRKVCFLSLRVLHIVIA